jgi:polyphenol oxidase
MDSKAASVGADRGPPALVITETPVEGPIPRYEIPEWRERYGVTAGITARGPGPGQGFDLGLWSEAPVGEVMSRWRAFRGALPGFNAVVLGNQVHGAEVMAVETGRGWIQIEGIDGWVTTSPGILLTVTLADCIPVYLVIPRRGVGLVHAGWRGTAAGILARGLRRLTGALGALPADVIMHCGVGICGSCYEVGSEVVEGCGLPANGAGPWQVDLRSRLVQQAREEGIERISVSTWCSAHDHSRFYSHRASRGTDGRMVAYLGLLGDQVQTAGTQTVVDSPLQRG